MRFFVLVVAVLFGSWLPVTCGAEGKPDIARHFEGLESNSEQQRFAALNALKQTPVKNLKPERKLIYKLAGRYEDAALQKKSADLKFFNGLVYLLVNLASGDAELISEFLQSDIEALRFSALKRVGNLNEKASSVIDVLFEMMEDESKRVSKSALEVLGKMGRYAPLDVLVDEMSEQHSGRVSVALTMLYKRPDKGRPGAEEVLGLFERKDKKLEKQLIHTIRNMGEKVLPEVKKELEKGSEQSHKLIIPLIRQWAWNWSGAPEGFSEELSAVLLGGDIELAKEAAEALVVLGEKGAQSLGEVVKNGSATRAALAIEALSRSTAKAKSRVRELMKGLERPEESVQEAALTGLIVVGKKNLDKAQFEKVVRLVNGGPPWLQPLAAEVIAINSGKSGSHFKLMLECMKRKNEVLTRHCAIAAGKIADSEKKVSALAEGLQSIKVTEKLSALTALGQRKKGRKKHFQKIIELLNDSELEVRAKSAWVLAEVAPGRLVEVLGPVFAEQTLSNKRLLLRAVFEKKKWEFVDEKIVRAGLEDSGSEIKVATIRLLAFNPTLALKVSGAITPLLSSVNQEEKAFAVLAKLNCGRSIGSAVRAGAEVLATNKLSAFKASFGVALVKLGVVVVPELVGMTRFEQARVQSFAYQSLAAIGKRTPSVNDALVTGLKSKRNLVRHSVAHAILVLGGDEEVSKMLIKGFENSSRVQIQKNDFQRVSRAAFSVCDISSGYLGVLLKHKNNEVKRAALHNLGNHPGLVVRHMDVLLELVVTKGPYLYGESFYALRNAGPKTTGLLIKVLKKSKYSQRQKNIVVQALAGHSHSDEMVLPALLKMENTRYASEYLKTWAYQPEGDLELLGRNLSDIKKSHKAALAYFLAEKGTVSFWFIKQHLFHENIFVRIALVEALLKMKTPPLGLVKDLERIVETENEGEVLIAVQKVLRHFNM